MKRASKWFIAIAIVAVICWRFPLFHIVPLKKAVADKAAATFNPAQFAELFWTEKLIPAIAKSTPAEPLLKKVQTDPAAAKKEFARGIGLGESYFYFINGNGRVLSISDDEVLLNTTGGTNVEVSLQSSLIFGSALRDGTGLLNVSDYPNSQDFNGIAEALNHIVETRVQPALREQAKIGAIIFFAGCAEISDESSDLKPLKVIPVQTKTK